MTALVLNHLWQSSLFAGAIWALTLLFRNNGAAVRHGLWLAASVKFLLPFSLLAAIGGMSFTHTVAASSMQALTRIEPAAAPFAAMAPVLAASGQQPLSWIVIAAAIWGLGSAAVVLFWLTRALRLGKIVRAAMPLALEAPVPVRLTSQLLEPGLAGIFHPVILLPESLSQKLSQTEIDAILAHELCHLRRRDNLAAMIHMLVEAMFWFHPLVWYIGARLVEEREQACDEGVLDDGKKPFDYAQAILKVCRLYFRSPLPCASGVSGADLDRRITAIMVGRDADEVDPNKILLLAGLGAFVVMTPLLVGGLKTDPAARTFASALVRLQQAVRNPITAGPGEATAPARKAHTARLPHPGKSPPVIAPRQIAAPQIDASLPIIVVNTPEIAVETQTPNAADMMVCRAPQQLQDSRLLGPRVCLPQREWDRLKAQGLRLMPDGRTLAAGYDQARWPNSLTCVVTGTGASTATSSAVLCHQ